MCVIFYFLNHNLSIAFLCDFNLMLNFILFHIIGNNSYNHGIFTLKINKNNY